MTGRTKLISVALAAIAALTIILGAAPAQARVFVGFAFYPYYRPFFPVFFRPHLPPRPPVYVVPRPAYYAPPPVAYNEIETETYTYRRPVHRHRRTVSHRTCTCK
jgi:hypothetical protein